jgi:hypothetical protein
MSSKKYAAKRIKTEETLSPRLVTIMIENCEISGRKGSEGFQVQMKVIPA